MKNRYVEFENPGRGPSGSILVSNEVIGKLQHNQLASLRKPNPTQPNPTQPNPPLPLLSEPQKVPDVGGACCCLHAPLHRPTVTVDEVKQRLDPMERLHETANAEWKRRDAMRNLPDECQIYRSKLIEGYMSNLESTLNCATLCRDYEKCLWEHREKIRAQNEAKK